MPVYTFQTRESNQTQYISHICIKDVVNALDIHSFTLRLLLCVMCEHMFFFWYLAMVCSIDFNLGLLVLHTKVVYYAEEQSTSY